MSDYKPSTSSHSASPQPPSNIGKQDGADATTDASTAAGESTMQAGSGGGNPSSAFFCISFTRTNLRIQGNTMCASSNVYRHNLYQRTFAYSPHHRLLGPTVIL